MNRTRSLVKTLASLAHFIAATVQELIVIELARRATPKHKDPRP